MKHILTQIIGVVLVVLGIQGAIRVAANANDPGFLAWLPGGASAHVGAYVAIAIAGGLLADWANKRRRAAAK